MIFTDFNGKDTASMYFYNGAIYGVLNTQAHIGIGPSRWDCRSGEVDSMLQCFEEWNHKNIVLPLLVALLLNQMSSKINRDNFRTDLRGIFPALIKHCL